MRQRLRKASATQIHIHIDSHRRAITTTHHSKLTTTSPSSPSLQTHPSDCVQPLHYYLDVVQYSIRNVVCRSVREGER